jgi:hypothetical protein
MIFTLINDNDWEVKLNVLNFLLNLITTNPQMNVHLFLELNGDLLITNAVSFILF